MDALLQSTLLIAVAEMGDKSQLVALAYATRFSWKLALGGVTLATLIVHLLSVGVGEALGMTLPTAWIHLLTGLAFVGFGIWTLRGDALTDDQEPGPLARFGPLLTITGTFFLSELGDKTMLATVMLAGQLQNWVPVWLGSTLGMVAADAVVIVAGIVLGKRLPERAIQLAAAAVFLVLGVASTFGAVVALAAGR